MGEYFIDYRKPGALRISCSFWTAENVLSKQTIIHYYCFIIYKSNFIPFRFGKFSLKDLGDYSLLKLSTGFASAALMV